MELSPEALREAQFTERFRGYDAAEVDSYLNEVADALEALIAESSSEMAEAAAARARLAIEQVRRESLAAIEELRGQQDSLEEAVAELLDLLYQRRKEAVAEIALIDAALRAGAVAAEPSAEDAGTPDGENGDTGDPEDPGSEASDSEEADPEPGDPGEAGEDGAPDTFLSRLEQAGAELDASESPDGSRRRRSIRNLEGLSGPD